MGEMLKSLNILPFSDVVCKSASDFSTGYVGQSGPQMRKILTESLGKVLFIDEAYRLKSDAFLLQAADELVQALTEPKFMGKLSVILAGYEADIADLLQVNAGLKSRFSSPLRFSPFTVEDSCRLMKMKMNENDLVLHVEAERELPSLMQQLVKRQNFGNGRDVDTWAKRVFRTVAKRKYEEKATKSEGEDTVTVTDLMKSLSAMLEVLCCFDNFFLIN